MTERSEGLTDGLVSTLWETSEDVHKSVLLLFVFFGTRNQLKHFGLSLPLCLPFEAWINGQDIN